MSAVSFRGVTKRFGGIVALNNLDLEVEEGEFVSLLGPSGSGKSTTLNVLAGLLGADEGEIVIGGRDVTELSPDQRDIALVFQSYALYPHMTVFENIAFPLRAKRRKTRIAEDEIIKRVEAVANTLGIGTLLARYPRELSGGQQQRVALGRAMVRDPKVFLLDEPLSNLDARLRIRMRHDLKELHERLRSTIVYVTHDQAEAMSMSSRIAVFNEGKLQQYAPPDEIYNRPANLFVANFVGERELVTVEGTLRQIGQTFELTGSDLRVVLPAVADFPIPEPQPVIIGLRAEAVRLARPDDADAFDAEVSRVELSGPDLIIYARTARGVELCCRTEPNLSIVKGSAVRLATVPMRIHAFDSKSGVALPIHAKKDAQP